jgi:hypothetical protein
LEPQAAQASEFGANPRLIPIRTRIQLHPGAPVLLITDPWQLARATHAFNHQGLAAVQPLVAEPATSASARNRLALRETAATLLYRAQGRICCPQPVR